MCLDVLAIEGLHRCSSNTEWIPPSHMHLTGSSRTPECNALTLSFSSLYHLSHPPTYPRAIVSFTSALAVKKSRKREGCNLVVRQFTVLECPNAWVWIEGETKPKKKKKKRKKKNS